jgi:hypothetical protein
MLSRACGRYSAPKNSFRSDHHSQPTHGTHAADLMLARALELELELIQTQMAQKKMLRAAVYARALRASPIVP